MELILNELSIKVPLKDVPTARDRMQELLKTCREAVKHGATNCLRTQESFKDQLIAEGYPIIKWLNDSMVDRELQRYFKTLVTKAPYIDQDIEKEIYKRALGHDFLLHGENAVGFGVAYLLDTLSVSFNSDQKWDTHQISVQANYIDDEGELITDEIEIKHAVKVEHIKLHEDWFNVQRRDSIVDGADLWRRRAELLPSLILCDSVEEQLSKYKSSDPIFKQIKKKLFILEGYFSVWANASFDSTQIACKTTPESIETLNRYAYEHTFVCPDGEERVFSWHIRTTPGDGRIFFFPEEKLGKGIIGHIGAKLSTVKYPK